MGALLLTSSTIALALLVWHSWRMRGRAVTLWFFLVGLAFGIARGNAVWYIVSTLEDRPEALKPYLPQEGLLPDIGHDSLQVALGWVFALYLAWTVAEFILKRIDEAGPAGGRKGTVPFHSRVFMIGALASLFMFTIAYAMETTAVSAGWWYWTLPTRTALFGNVNAAGVWAWFSVAHDFLIPFLVIVCAGKMGPGPLTSSGVPGPFSLRWLWLAAFPFHMLAHRGYASVPYLYLIHPAMTLLVVSLMFSAKTRMARGAWEDRHSCPSHGDDRQECLSHSAPEGRRPPASVLPAVALAIFFSVLVMANAVSHAPRANYVTLAPMLLLCALAWRRVPVIGVAGLSALALGGWVWAGPRALYALAPVAAWGLFEGFARLREPLWMRLAAPAGVVLLAACVVVAGNADDARTFRYREFWDQGDAAMQADNATRAAALYARSDASRPHDTFYFYCAIHEMTRLDLMTRLDRMKRVERLSPDNALRLFQFRMPRLIGEFEEVVARDPEWIAPRRDIARLRVMRGELGPAVDQYRTIVAWQPRNADAQAMLGYLLLRDHNVTAADRVLSALVARPRPPVEATINLGVIRFHQRRDAEARGLWEEARRRKPSHPAADWNIERLSDPDDDREIDTRFLAMKCEPGVAPLVLNLAAWGRDLSDADKIRLAVEATQFDPLFVDAHNNLAQVYRTEKFHNPKLALWHARRVEAAERTSKDDKRRK